MKKTIHLRQFSFTPHPWQDLVTTGITTQRLAPEHAGYRKNTLLLNIANSSTQVILHHWMICDESQTDGHLESLRLNEYSPSEYLEPAAAVLELQKLWVADEDALTYYGQMGLPCEIPTDEHWRQYFSIRKAHKAYACLAKSNVPLRFDLELGFLEGIKKPDGSEAIHLLSGSQCLDFIITK